MDSNQLASGAFFTMMRMIYRMIFPVAFLGFLPGMYWKLKHRPGYKATYGERFGKFTPEREQELKNSFQNAVWLHAVSVGETMIALALLAEFQKVAPQRKFVLSTTTTTAQQLAREKAPASVAVIYCPLDFTGVVRKVFDLLHPSMLVIFETEIWPNLIWEAHDRNIPAVLVNARMSDHSAKGYRRFRCFFGGLLGCFDRIIAQSENDAERYRSVSTAENVVNGGNLKFDQKVPENLAPINLDGYFTDAPRRILLAASTHPGEEALIAESFSALKKKYSDLKLVIAPRHAERGNEVAEILKAKQLTFAQRSREKDRSEAAPVDCLLADTTGELLRFIAGADVVIMGKSLAGQDEGHNLIEPALLSKATVTGSVLRNFRPLLSLLREADAVVTVAPDEDLTVKLEELFADEAKRRGYGERAKAAVEKNAGAAKRAVAIMEELLEK